MSRFVLWVVLSLFGCRCGVQKQHRLIKPIQDLPADNILQSCDDEERLQQVSGDEDLMISQSLIFLPNVGAPYVVPTVTCSQVSSVILSFNAALNQMCSESVTAELTPESVLTDWACAQQHWPQTWDSLFDAQPSSQAWVCLERSAEVSPRLRD